MCLLSRHLASWKECLAPSSWHLSLRYLCVLTRSLLSHLFRLNRSSSSALPPHLRVLQSCNLLHSSTLDFISQQPCKLNKARLEFMVRFKWKSRSSDKFVWNQSTSQGQDQVQWFLSMSTMRRSEIKLEIQTANQKHTWPGIDVAEPKTSAPKAEPRKRLRVLKSSCVHGQW